MKAMKFPSLEEFKIFLEDERDTIFTTSKIACYRFITDYFSNREFNKINFRLMLNELRQGIGKDKPLKRTSVNKYLHIGKLLAKYLELSFLEDFIGYKDREEATPLGDLISDSEMEAIANCTLIRPYTNPALTEEINIKYKTAFTLMRFSGIAPVDLCNLTWNNDKLTHFDLKRAKTGKQILIPIVSPLRTLLDTLPHLPHGYIFGSSQGRMKEATINLELRKRCEYLHIKKHVTAYSFRYSMITHCYINAGEATIPKIAKITGHTIQTAFKHYAKFDVKTLTDALLASHPGLRQSQSIDSIKRTMINLLCNLIDISKYEVKLEITPKTEDKRTIHLS